MKKIIPILILIFFLTGNRSAKAQDFHLSMYDAGPLFLNPAMTGVVDATWRVHAQYRNQWRSVAFKPYSTALISFDAPVKKWGFGGQVMNMRAGIGNYNVFQAMFSTAYQVSFDKNKYHNLSLGLQAGVTQKSVEYKIFTFDNQYVTTNGGGFDQSINNQESFQRQSMILPQVNAGAMYYYSRMQSRLNPFIGASAFNLTQPKETYFGASNNLPMRIYIHSGIRVNITEQFYILPKMLIMMQKNAQEQTYALDAGYFMGGSELWLLGGFVYRSKDAAIISLGARKDNYIAKLSYDVNISTLSATSSGRGAFEISFTYMGRKPKVKQVKSCPRL
ncbi:MAG: PorP/SprF family type IX secretion system membrane protein [Bacteroidia bacterium]|nr:PorP/SprF family type IX secretion system membrane protein [Bacteroidia bacterium]